jgi:hypothetical protein
LRDYSKMFLRMLCFLIRHHVKPVQGYHIPLTAGQMTTLDQLWKGLKDGQSVRTHFHSLALSILAECPSSNWTDRYRFPLVRFLCVVHLNHDGSWVSQKEVTHTFAALAWTFRAVCCIEMCTPQHGPPEDEGSDGMPMMLWE